MIISEGEVVVMPSYPAGRRNRGASAKPCGRRKDGVTRSAGKSCPGEAAAAAAEFQLVRLAVAAGEKGARAEGDIERGSRRPAPHPIPIGPLAQRAS